ncbi:MAG: CPBP family intramembrane metalloprotease [Eubacteriales bacterium]|nr:CPBP family intramembrane metalloprotease [Eubacteriales bacterium]
MSRRRLLCLPGAAASVAAALLLPGLFPADAGFTQLCVLLALQEILLLGLPALLIMLSSPASTQALKGLWGRPTAWHSGLSMLAAVSFTLVSVLITVVFLALLQSFGISPPEGMALVPQSPGQLVAAALCATVIPAASEELLFRGLIQGILSARFSNKVAILVSAALFALLHRSVLAFPQILAIGLVLGILRARSGGLMLPIIFHAFYNFAVLVLNYSGAVPTLGMMLLCVGIFTVSFKLMAKQEVPGES